MRRTMMSTLATALMAVVLWSGVAVSQGKGKGSDKPVAGEDRGKGKGSEARAAKAERPVRAQPQQRAQRDRDPGQARGRGEGEAKGRSADRTERADQPRGAERGRGAAASEFGRARAAEVRELGGEVAGPADPMAANRAAARRDRIQARNANAKGKFFRSFDPDDAPDAWRTFALSPRLPERFAGRLATLAVVRGVPETALLIRPADDRIVIANTNGVMLLDLDEQKARNLGAWRVVALDDRDLKDGAPAFCRSGAGHPVWGRQWCLDKGFGLGVDADRRWGRAVELEDIVFRRRGTSGDLTRDVLATVLGDIVVSRLAAHAITLGLVEPLVGRWVDEPAGRRVLLVNSGAVPVAEIVDTDRDDRAEILLVALKPW